MVAPIGSITVAASADGTDRKCKPYLEALKAAPKAVKEFIDGILKRFKKQEKSIEYEPISASKTHTQERGKRSINNSIER